MTESSPRSDSKPHHRRRTLLLAGFAGMVVAGLIGAAGGLAIVEFGLFDATASMPHLRPVAWAAHRAFITSVQARAGSMPTPTITPAEVAAGFRQYEQDCVQCHGGPGVSRGDLAAGMTPAPPYLIDAARRWTPSQLYWILAQGVKMTAMPSWRATRTNLQVWNLVAFLEALPYLSPEQYRKMRGADISPLEPPAAGGTAPLKATVQPE